MKTSERLLKKMQQAFPDNEEVHRQDVILISNKAFLRFGGCYNWFSDGYTPIFSYHTMNNCLKAKNLDIYEKYLNGVFCGWLIVPEGERNVP